MTLTFLHNGTDLVVRGSIYPLHITLRNVIVEILDGSSHIAELREHGCVFLCVLFDGPHQSPHDGETRDMSP